MSQLPRWTLALIAPSLVGGLIGSLLVVAWPQAFSVLVPWLILTAALLFALQPRISRWAGVAQGPGGESATPHRWQLAAAVTLQFFVSVYGGYFGAGIGILMLSVLGFMGLSDINEMNALKSLLNALINGVSVIVFAACGKIHWQLALVMAVASIIGGYGAARIARRLNRVLVRRTVVVIGFGLAVFYFYRQWTA